jgi:hypothetical protein
MRTRSAIRKHFLAGAALCLAWSQSFAQSSADPVAALAPDERPTLIVQLPAGPLMLARQPSLSTTQRLAFSLGLRARPRQSLESLPQAWRTQQSDRGLAGELRTALDPPQANWPWRELRVLGGSEPVDRELDRHAGADVAIARLSSELQDLGTRVQLVARAEVTIVRALGTVREARSHILLRHLATSLLADPVHPQRAAAQFRAAGPLDQAVRVAALDLSRLLAVTVERADAPGGLTASAGRRFKDLPRDAACSECRPDDAVLHQETGRIWIAPARSPNTIVSLPLSRPAS